MTKIYEYRMFCETESLLKKVLRYDYEEAPTLCPDNSGHTIKEGSVFKELIHEDNEVIAKPSNLIASVSLETGDEQTIGCEIEVSALDSVSKMLSCFDTSRDVLGGYVYYKDAKDSGDDYLILDCIPYGDVSIGKIAEDADENDTEIKVDSDTLLYVKLGYYLEFLDNENGEERRIVEINESTQKITLNEGIHTDLSINDNIRVRAREVDNFWIIPKLRMPFNLEVKRAKQLSLDYQMRARYFHSVPSEVVTSKVKLWAVCRY